MADDTTKTIRIVVDASRAVSGGRAAQRALEQIERQTGVMASAIESATSLLTKFGAALAVKFSVESLSRAVDAFTAFGNALKVAGVEGETARAVQDRLFAAANRNGVEIGALSQLYSRASVAAGELGASQSKLLQFVDGVTAALRIQGGSSEAASGALLQLSQSLGSGIVRAEEFNSILEGAFPIAQAAARGIDGMGGSVAKLRSAIIEGHVTSQQFFAGLLKGFGETEKMAQSMSLTIGQSMTANANAWTRFIGTLDKATGVSAAVSEAIAASTKRIDEWTKSVEAGANSTSGWSYALSSFKKDWADFVEVLGKVNEWGKSTSIKDWTRDTLEAAAVGIARWNGYIVEAFNSLPTLIGGAFVSAMNAALSAVEAGVNKIIGVLGPLVRQIPGLESIGSSVDLGRLTGGIGYDQYRARVLAAGTDAASRQREVQQAEADARENRRMWAESADYAERMQGAAQKGAINLDASPGPGAAPMASKGGQAEAQSLQKLTDSLNAAVVAQNAMTDAARRGDVAFQEQQAAADAMAKAIEHFGGKVSAADPKVKALAETLQKPIFEKMQGAAAQAFVVATTELDKQNDLLAAQIALMNEAPEIQARELAIIKSKQEAQKAGTALTAQDIENRRAAIEQNETLKLQAEQMRKANELWTAPLKQALENIQTAGADAWKAILETGNFTFQSLADVFTKTLRRMAAEFLALATIRPVMSLAVDVIGPGGLGLIGGNTAAQLGFPAGGSVSSSGGGGLGNILGGGGTGSIFSSGGGAGGGWLSRQVSGIGAWLGSPVSPPSGATLGGGAFGPAGPGLGGLTWGGALSGIGSIGMGAYSMLSGGGSTSSMIGGGAGILGGGLALLGPMLGLGAAAGPIGLGIGLVGSILGSLFGDSGPKIPPQPALAYGAGQFRPSGAGYSYTGDQLGSGTAMNSAAESIATNLTKAFRAAGLAVVPGALIGGNIASGTDHTLQGGQWQDRPYTQTGLMLPGGGYESLTYNDSSRNVDQASEYLLAQAFKANVLRGGVSGAGEGLKAGLDKLNPFTNEDLDRVVSLGTAYDKLGDAINPAKDALDKISASFDDLKTFATQAGLSLDPINAELAKQSKRSAQDFIDAMLDPLAVQMRALDDAKEQALTSAEYIKQNFTDVFVDLDKITAYYGQKRLDLEDQFYSGGITNLQKLIDSLSPGGALANEDPTTKLAGLRSIYDTTLAGARGGDVASIANLAGVAGQYAEYGQSYFAGSAEYTALRDQIVAAAQEVRAIAQGDTSATDGGSATASQNSAAVKDLIASQQRTQATVDQLAALVAETREENTELKNLLSRYITTKR